MEHENFRKYHLVTIRRNLRRRRIFHRQYRIIGIPFGLQTVKLGILALWPFGSEIVHKQSPHGCLSTLMNIIWFFIGGIWIFLSHIFWGVLFCITIIGIPFGMQHFKLAGLALTPFGHDVK